MTPPRSSKGRRANEPLGVNRRRRRRRVRARKQRFRRTVVIAALIGIPVVVLVAGTVGATAVFGSRCDLNALRPVAVGQNS